MSLQKKPEKSYLSATQAEKHFTSKNGDAKFRIPRKSYLLALLILIAITPLVFLVKGMTSVRADSAIHHYFYVFPDHTLDVYDMDNNFQLVQQISLPTDGWRTRHYCRSSLRFSLFELPWRRWYPWHRITSQI